MGLLQQDPADSGAGSQRRKPDRLGRTHGTDRHTLRSFMFLKGKVAIVTGGNSGIGKAIVLELAEQGASVAIDYVSHADATEELERQIVALGDRTIGVDADVSKVADLQRLIDATVKA